MLPQRSFSSTPARLKSAGDLVLGTGEGGGHAGGDAMAVVGLDWHNVGGSSGHRFSAASAASGKSIAGRGGDSGALWLPATSGDGPCTQSSLRAGRGSWPLLQGGFEPLGPMLRSLEFQVDALFELMDAHTSRDVADCTVAEVIGRKRDSLMEMFDTVKEALWWQQRRQGQARRRLHDVEVPWTMGLDHADAPDTSVPVPRKTCHGGLRELEALQMQLAARVTAVLEDGGCSDGSATHSSWSIPVAASGTADYAVHHTQPLPRQISQTDYAANGTSWSGAPGSLAAVAATGQRLPAFEYLGIGGTASAAMDTRRSSPGPGRRDGCPGAVVPTHSYSCPLASVVADEVAPVGVAASVSLAGRPSARPSCQGAVAQPGPQLRELQPELVESSPLTAQCRASSVVGTSAVPCWQGSHPGSGRLVADAVPTAAPLTLSTGSMASLGAPLQRAAGAADNGVSGALFVPAIAGSEQLLVNGQRATFASDDMANGPHTPREVASLLQRRLSSAIAAGSGNDHGNGMVAAMPAAAAATGLQPGDGGQRTVVSFAEYGASKTLAATAAAGLMQPGPLQTTLLLSADPTSSPSATASAPTTVAPTSATTTSVADEGELLKTVAPCQLVLMPTVFHFRSPD